MTNFRVFFAFFSMAIRSDPLKFAGNIALGTSHLPVKTNFENSKKRIFYGFLNFANFNNLR